MVGRNESYWSIFLVGSPSLYEVCLHACHRWIVAFFFDDQKDFGITIFAY